MNTQSRKIAEDQRELIEFRIEHLQAVMRGDRASTPSGGGILEELRHLRALQARLERDLTA
jgi:hypothetical protein